MSYTYLNQYIYTAISDIYMSYYIESNHNIPHSHTYTQPYPNLRGQPYHTLPLPTIYQRIYRHISMHSGNFSQGVDACFAPNDDLLTHPTVNFPGRLRKFTDVSDILYLVYFPCRIPAIWNMYAQMFMHSVCVMGSYIWRANLHVLECILPHALRVIVLISDAIFE